jgi:hypothetical protein
MCQKEKKKQSVVFVQCFVWLFFSGCSIFVLRVVIHALTLIHSNLLGMEFDRSRWFDLKQKKKRNASFAFIFFFSANQKKKFEEKKRRESERLSDWV